LTLQPRIPLNAPKKKILCVEDHTEMGELIAIDLPEYEVTGVYSKAEALEKATGERFDLYLLDYHLPDGTGLELCLLIRAFDPDTPIFFCTGSDLLTIDHIKTAGGQRFIFKNETFLWKLREAVNEVFSQPDKSSAAAER
jgi:CheY-like chemotaxis protein